MIKMDLRIRWSCIEQLRPNERCFVTMFPKQRAGGLLRILSYSVSCYLYLGFSPGTNGDVSVETCNTWWSHFSWELRVCFSSLLSSATTIIYIPFCVLLIMRSFFFAFKGKKASS